MHLPIGSDKSSSHEAHVGMEAVDRAHARRRVRARSGQVEIGLPDHTVEVEDRRRVAASRVSRVGFGIGRRVNTVDAGRKEEVERAESGRRPGVDVRNRLLLRALRRAALSVSIVVIVIAERRRPEAGAEDAAGSTGRDPDELTP